MANLTRFWITFSVDRDRSNPPSYLLLSRGCGVTAQNLDDAIGLLKEKLFGDDPMPGVKSVVEDVDISTLDPGHVLPNIGISVDRGVWYPNLS
jgi:hypothetical protein